MPHKHIHRILKEQAPHAVHKAKRLLAFKYPKLLLLVATIGIAYYLFSLPGAKTFVASFNNLGYFGDFISGILFAFGFTVPFSIGFFITSHPVDIILATIIASVGSVVGDLVIFKTIKFSFIDEFKELEKKKVLKKIGEIVKNNKHVLIRHYLVYIFAGIILASPLPDEIGVSMLAGLTTIKTSTLAIISFILHAIPIYLIFYFSAV